MSEEDFNIKITIRNGRLLKAIRAKYATVADMCRKMNRGPAQVNSLVTMRDTPLRRSKYRDDNGEYFQDWSDLALDICAMVGKEPEELWPEHMKEMKLRKATAEVSMDFEGVQRIANSNSRDKALSQLSVLEKFSESITPREKKVLRLRFVENLPLEEVAKMESITRERVRQIECKALRKMRNRAVLFGYARKGEPKSYKDRSDPYNPNNIFLTGRGRDLFED